MEEVKALDTQSGKDRGKYDCLCESSDENAKLFEKQRQYANMLETLAEIGQIDSAVQKFGTADEILPGHVPALEGWRAAALKGQLWIDVAQAASRQAKAAPDAATLSTGVVSQASNAAAALAANAHAMTAVFDTLHRAGIADKNIQTSGISLSPQYGGKQGQPQHIVGYQVSNTVSVFIDKLDKVGSVIDALVAAGSNQIDGPNFIIADPKPLLAKARAEAVKDAIAKAQTYAAAAGVTLGPILSISEGGSTAPQPMGRMMAMWGSPAT